MSQTSIEWTDFSVNPIRARYAATQGHGHYCEKVSPGCAHCYSSRMQPRFGMPVFDVQRRGGVEPYLDATKFQEVLGRKKPTKFFWCDMTDMFGSWVPDEWIDRCFAVMALTPQHVHQVLTKRPERMRDYFGFNEDEPLSIRDRIDDASGNFGACHANLDASGRWPLPNVWLGVSCENQETADERIPLLLQASAAIRFISAEPLLSAINLRPHFFSLEHVKRPGACRRCGRGHGFTRCPNYGAVAPTDSRQPACDRFERLGGEGVDWVIVGGESGPGARPMNLEWARSVVKQCEGAGVKCFVKQLGAMPVNSILGPVNPVNLRTVRAITDRKGGDPAEWPEDLRVREYPT